MTMSDQQSRPGRRSRPRSDSGREAPKEKSALSGRLKHFVRSVWRLLQDAGLYINDTIVLLRTSPLGERNGTGIVRLDAIGDFVIWQAAARHLHLEPGSGPVVLFANAAWASLAEQLNIWDAVFPIDTKQFVSNFEYRAQLIKSIRDMNIDTCIAPTFSRSFSTNDAVVRATNARVRIGQKGDHSNIGFFQKIYADHIYSRLFDVQINSNSELERTATFVEYITGTVLQRSRPVISPINGGSSIVNEPISHFVVFPGATWEGRRWPVERFAEVSKRVAEAYKITPVLCGGPEDSHRGIALEELINIPVVNLIGKTSLSDLVGLIGRSSLVITNETSAAHIAIATSAPVVCLLGGGHFGRFLPYPNEFGGGDENIICLFEEMACFGCNWECRYRRPSGRPTPCVDAISVERVWEAVQTVLDRRSDRQQIMPILPSPC
jgi:ADP-heptose:LPS heptosyltransferase